MSNEIESEASVVARGTSVMVGKLLMDPLKNCHLFGFPGLQNGALGAASNQIRTSSAMQRNELLVSSSSAMGSSSATSP